MAYVVFTKGVFIALTKFQSLVDDGFDATQSSRGEDANRKVFLAVWIFPLESRYSLLESGS